MLLNSSEIRLGTGGSYVIPEMPPSQILGWFTPPKFLNLLSPAFLNLVAGYVTGMALSNDSTSTKRGQPKEVTQN